MICLAGEGRVQYLIFLEMPTITSAKFSYMQTHTWRKWLGRCFCQQPEGSFIQATIFVSRHVRGCCQQVDVLGERKIAEQQLISASDLLDVERPFHV